MSPWEKLLERPHARGHFVQLYEADGLSLIGNAGFYLWEGLKRGDGVLLIATEEHRESFYRQLDRMGADTRLSLRSRQLVFFDARETLVRFMAGGQPDWRLFERVIGSAMRDVRPADDDAGLRAYGEMVGVLWKARQFAAAIRMEQLWNKLLEQSSFSLYCAYEIDVFGDEFRPGVLDAILCAHTHLIPAQPNGKLDEALNVAIDEVCGGDAGNVRRRIGADRHPSWAIMPDAEATILWLRSNLPREACDIVARSRHHYRLLGNRPGLVKSADWPSSVIPARW